MKRRKAQLVPAGASACLKWTPGPLARIAPAWRRAAVVVEDGPFLAARRVD